MFARAEAELERLLARMPDQYVPALSVASAYAGLGAAGPALDWLDQAIDARDY